MSQRSALSATASATASAKRLNFTFYSLATPLAPGPKRGGRIAVAAVVAGLLSACGAQDHGTTWKLPNGRLAGTRAAAGSAIDAGNVAKLESRWRFALTAAPTFSGIFASTPIACGRMGCRRRKSSAP